MSTRTRLARRLARSAPAARARQARQRLAPLFSPAARTAARGTSLPRGYRWLRLGSIGVIDGPVAGYIRRDLIARPLTEAEPSLDAVLVTAAVPGAPDRLDERVVDALIECERRSIPTIFVAHSGTDVTSPLPGLCRVTLIERDDMIPVITPRLGSQRTMLVRTGADWLPALARISRAG